MQKVGAAMRQAAAEVKKSAAKIAREIGVTPKTIYRWWGDEQEPSAGDMYRYCQSVGRDVGEMYGESVPERLLSLFQAAADRLMAGQSLGKALERALGPTAITEAERAALDANSVAFRELLRRCGGKE